MATGNATQHQQEVLYAESLVVGVQGSQKTITGTEIGYLDALTAGTAAASSAVVTDASINVAGLNVVGIARIDWDSSTATLSSNAATITKWTCVVTTEALTTAHTAAASLVITKTGVAAGDIAMISMVGGTNTAGVPVFNAACTTDTVTITLRNNAIATNAFNGTFIFNLIIYKA